MKLTLSFQLNHPVYRKQRAALRALIIRACKAALAQEGIAQAELSVVLADDEAIRALNRDFRGKDKPTNVLAFPDDRGWMIDDKNKTPLSSSLGHLSSDSAPRYLGDIIISLDTAAAEAEAQGKTFGDHLTHLCVHACLHLLGHDHEDKKEAARMEEKEIKILKNLKVENPYL